MTTNPNTAPDEDAPDTEQPGGDDSPLDAPTESTGPEPGETEED